MAAMVSESPVKRCPRKGELRALMLPEDVETPLGLDLRAIASYSESIWHVFTLVMPEFNQFLDFFVTGLIMGLVLLVWRRESVEVV